MLEWVDDGNFIDLGYREYNLVEVDGVECLQVDPDSAAGILTKPETSAYRNPVPLAEIPENLRRRVVAGPLPIVTKANAESTVHRPVRMDSIGVKKLGPADRVRGEMRLLGLSTSKALSTPVKAIPILHRKLKKVPAMDQAVERRKSRPASTSSSPPRPRSRGSTWWSWNGRSPS